MKLSKLQIFFQKQVFFGGKEKQNWKPLITQTERAMKNVVLK